MVYLLGTKLLIFKQITTLSVGNECSVEVYLLGTKLLIFKQITTDSLVQPYKMTVYLLGTKLLIFKQITTLYEYDCMMVWVYLLGTKLLIFKQITTKNRKIFLKLEVITNCQLTYPLFDISGCLQGGTESGRPFHPPHIHI